MLDLPVVRNLRKVKLRHPPVFSRFWRYHTEGVGHISTIEGKMTINIIITIFTYTHIHTTCPL